MLSTKGCAPTDPGCIHLEQSKLPPKVQKCRQCDDGCLCLN